VQIDSLINRLLDLLQGVLDTNCFDMSKASCGRLRVLLSTGALFNDEDGANEERDWDDKEQRMVFGNACDVKKGDRFVADVSLVGTLNEDRFGKVSFPTLGPLLEALGERSV
jgi:hypothetical protein